MNILLFPYAKNMRNDKAHPKNYPFWAELVVLLKENNHVLTQLGVTDEIQLVDDFRKNLSYAELCELIKNCDTWISVDSYGQHLAWSVGKRGIALFGQSDPRIFGHHENINLLKDRKYLRSHQFWLWEQCEVNDDVWVTPLEVVSALNEHFIA